MARDGAAPRIDSCVILGRGALGMLYASLIEGALGPDAVCFAMDEGRLARQAHERCLVNGSELHVAARGLGEAAPAQLLVVALKYGSLRPALDEIAALVGPSTTVISVMNGIDSERIIAERVDASQVLGCVAVGMDAMRDGSSLTYTKAGRLQLGTLRDGQEGRLAAVDDFLARGGVPHEVVGDIRQAMWRKFLLNVGINQACTVHETDYAHATREPLLHEMEQAMREVVAVAAAEGVTLGEDDIEGGVALERTLKPTGYPSMRQDMVAGRPTEVDMFAGTVVALGRRHGVPTPVNERWLHAIKDMEARQL